MAVRQKLDVVGVSSHVCRQHTRHENADDLDEDYRGSGSHHDLHIFNNDMFKSLEASVHVDGGVPFLWRSLQHTLATSGFSNLATGVGDVGALNQK